MGNSNEKLGEIHYFGSGEVVGSYADVSIPCKQLMGFNIVRVFAGGYHIVLLDDGGTAYTFGKGQHGQLGHGTIEHCFTPTPLPFIDVKIVHVAAGDLHTVVVSDKGDVYTFGCGEHGRLGHGSRSDISSPRLITSLKDIKITYCSAGLTHTALLDEKGHVYACGYNGNGQLGNGTEIDLDVPQQVILGKNLRISSVVAGYWHTLLLSDKGEVFSAGSGVYGQLGHGSVANLNKFRQVLTFEPGTVITQMACGGFHSVVLTDKGQVLTFGLGTTGQLGHGHFLLNANEPTPISALESVNVVQITAGYNHTVVYSDKGFVFTFGEGRFGQVGHGQTYDLFKPKIINKMKGTLIKQIAAGYQFSIVLGEPKSTRFKEFPEWVNDFGLTGVYDKQRASTIQNIRKSVIMTSSYSEYMDTCTYDTYDSVANETFDITVIKKPGVLISKSISDLLRNQSYFDTTEIENSQCIFMGENSKFGYPVLYIILHRIKAKFLQDSDNLLLHIIKTLYNALSTVGQFYIVVDLSWWPNDNVSQGNGRIMPVNTNTGTNIENVTNQILEIQNQISKGKSTSSESNGSTNGNSANTSTGKDSKDNKDGKQDEVVIDKSQEIVNKCLFDFGAIIDPVMRGNLFSKIVGISLVHPTGRSLPGIKNIFKDIPLEVFTKLVAVLPNWSGLTKYIELEKICLPFVSKKFTPMFFDVTKKSLSKKSANANRVRMFKMTPESILILDSEKTQILNEFPLQNIEGVFCEGEKDLVLVINKKDAKNKPDGYFWKNYKRLGTASKCFVCSSPLQRHQIIGMIMEASTQLCDSTASYAFTVVKTNHYGKKQKRILKLSTDSVLNIKENSIQKEIPFPAIQQVHRDSSLIGAKSRTLYIKTLSEATNNKVYNVCTDKCAELQEALIQCINNYIHTVNLDVHFIQTQKVDEILEKFFTQLRVETNKNDIFFSNGAYTNRISLRRQIIDVAKNAYTAFIQKNNVMNANTLQQNLRDLEPSEIKYVIHKLDRNRRESISLQDFVGGYFYLQSQKLKLEIIQNNKYGHTF